MVDCAVWCAEGAPGSLIGAYHLNHSSKQLCSWRNVDGNVEQRCKSRQWRRTSAQCGDTYLPRSMQRMWCEEVHDGWLPGEWAVGLLHRGGVSQQLGTVSCIIQLVSTYCLHILLIHHGQVHTCITPSQHPHSSCHYCLKIKSVEPQNGPLMHCIPCLALNR
jgi:hypothetical protein